jgi:hypothetical protein
MKTAVTLALCGAFFYAVYHYLFGQYLPDDAQWYKLAGASLLMLLPAAILINLPYYVSEMRLLRRAGTPVPRQGERIAVYGRLLPYGALLKAPFSGQECLSYSYGVYRWKGSKSRTREYDCGGNAMAPCFVRTANGDIRASGYLEGTRSDLDEEDPHANAQAYLAAARFRQLEPGSLLQGLQMVKDLATDESGAMREDWKKVEGPVDASHRRLEETILPPGKEYCVTGVWDAAKGGLVSRPFGSGALTVLEGDPQTAVKTMRSRMIFAAAVGLFLIAFLNVVIYAVLS